MKTVLGLLLIVQIGVLRALSMSKSTSKLSKTETLQRRSFLTSVASVAFASVAVTQPANASYSAYANREKDWESRGEKGEIKISTARDLRKQLRDIAPQNAASEIFCPNGPSANVTPMMENKCSDTMLATPSVFGRQEDIVGNSIPGFSTGSYRVGGVANAADLKSMMGDTSYGTGADKVRVNKKLIQ